MKTIHLNDSLILEKKIFDFSSGSTNYEEKEKIKKRMFKLINEVLPPKQRIYLLEYYFNGLKQYEIADKYGVACSTVCRGINHAKAKLGIKAYWLDLYIS
ncbi:MAG: hypothetical protein MR360_06105 [Ruminococcus sp.]|nr:hypothetical protein [Ruminococcus sp.]